VSTGGSLLASYFLPGHPDRDKLQKRKYGLFGTLQEKKRTKLRGMNESREGKNKKKKILFSRRLIMNGRTIEKGLREKTEGKII